MTVVLATDDDDAAVRLRAQRDYPRPQLGEDVRREIILALRDEGRRLAAADEAEVLQTVEREMRECVVDHQVIDIGMPDAARIHRASKAADRVVIYTHRDPKQLLAQWAGERIHKAEDVELYAVDQALVANLVAALQRQREEEDVDHGVLRG